MYSERIKIAFQKIKPNDTQQSNDMVNNYNEEKSLSISESLSKASIKSRQTAANADNLAPKFRRENAFCEDKKGKLDKALANTLPNLMEECKSHRRTTERAHLASPALNRENAFR